MSSAVEFTEEEQGRYDRQIRLWGIEAQQRMRNATILVVRMKGTATETIKNIVLAGIGTLIIVDGDDVTEEDLGAGFFFRDEDVGKKRVNAAKARIESLNPLVTVKTVPTYSAVDSQSFETTIRDVDLVCVTDWDKDGLIRMNEVCRRAGKPFYAGGTYGLLGYIFCDLLDHDYISPDRSGSKESQKDVKVTTSYTSLENALRHSWASLTKRQTKELNPGAVFTILALWKYESARGVLPSDPTHAAELQSIADTLLAEAGTNKQVLVKVPQELIESISTTAAHEFSPVCAIVGGMLAQDILKTLARRESPIANFFVFDGNTGGGTVSRLNMP
ncbi:sumo-activating enzyme subunit 1 [Moniliophthora roreri MCA 2997]|uniref:Ubiquitin-like 1-activating enzyme E1A n=1 Tax=Moniliophthora roreri (strain MCA 2997) TaxID=1381753 RepID=V2X9E4_MONRO|nr:sumo-activating enzyme subunit 1 [Moniliophthora roreri MCA 2997]